MGSVNDFRSNGDVRSRILLVDDQDSVLQSLYGILEGEGHEVLAAPSGAEALTIFCQSIRPIELLVTDYNMPQMSGLELARECSLLWRGLSVLYVSGSSLNEELKVDLQAGNRGFLAKPFRGDDLLRKIKALLLIQRSGYPQSVLPRGGCVDENRTSRPNGLGRFTQRPEINKGDCPL
jgi:CheY-like chemotaxis protein